MSAPDADSEFCLVDVPGQQDTDCDVDHFTVKDEAPGYGYMQEDSNLQDRFIVSVKTEKLEPEDNDPYETTKPEPTDEEKHSELTIKQEITIDEYSVLSYGALDEKKIPGDSSTVSVETPDVKIELSDVAVVKVEDIGDVTVGNTVSLVSSYETVDGSNSAITSNGAGIASNAAPRQTTANSAMPRIATIMTSGAITNSAVSSDDAIRNTIPSGAVGSSVLSGTATNIGITTTSITQPSRKTPEPRRTIPSSSVPFRTTANSAITSRTTSFCTTVSSKATTSSTTANRLQPPPIRPLQQLVSVKSATNGLGTVPTSQVVTSTGLVRPTSDSKVRMHMPVYLLVPPPSSSPNKAPLLVMLQPTNNSTRGVAAPKPLNQSPGSSSTPSTLSVSQPMIVTSGSIPATKAAAVMVSSESLALAKTVTAVTARLTKTVTTAASTGSLLATKMVPAPSTKVSLPLSKLCVSSQSTEPAVTTASTKGQSSITPPSTLIVPSTKALISSHQTLFEHENTSDCSSVQKPYSRATKATSSSSSSKSSYGHTAVDTKLSTVPTAVTGDCVSNIADQSSSSSTRLLVKCPQPHVSSPDIIFVSTRKAVSAPAQKSQMSHASGTFVSNISSSVKTSVDSLVKSAPVSSETSASYASSTPAAAVSNSASITPSITVASTTSSSSPSSPESSFTAQKSASATIANLQSQVSLVRKRMHSLSAQMQNPTDKDQIADCSVTSSEIDDPAVTDPSAAKRMAISTPDHAASSEYQVKRDSVHKRTTVNRGNDVMITELSQTTAPPEPTTQQITGRICISRNHLDKKLEARKRSIQESLELRAKFLALELENRRLDFEIQKVKLERRLKQHREQLEQEEQMYKMKIAQMKMEAAHEEATYKLKLLEAKDASTEDWEADELDLWDD